ncbi:MAG: nickel pincer cofactor biosynthesis protein LarB [Bacillota bacterium]|uniref:Nickel pincer cofactor biosynthesis protein LarB n=1 Tax=Thermanaerosceptrum fracticalcis TaxID=1712410 RepID=A0A7G6E7Q8_THEFR|nr:nickel pincer cofactor biosynthesis protein LarB [Thermanaerosceptrum fracticalcis]QNB48112.1 nickel pincer cofactor biosynthesis protein LarB [Thermanaerosceptrum fracticalcis]
MQEQIKKLLQAIQQGKVTVEEGMEQLKELPFKDLGFAKVDNHRALRQNHPEVIFCQGKTPQQIKEIVGYLAKNSNNILASRASLEAYEAIKEVCPEAEYHALARMVVVNRKPLQLNKGTILVVSAGTADLPVAEEAAITAEIMGNRVERLYDVGVAGLHRLLAHLDKLRKANVLVVVAGMEGALASVVGGLVSRPVIAVPTSVGYGANFHGLSALLCMLNSCAAGVGVVNIDNGFGAGRLAAIINEDAR